MEKVIKTEVIINYMNEHKINKNTFAKECKIGYETLQKVLSNQTNLRIRILFKIAQAMHISVKDLLYKE